VCQQGVFITQVLLAERGQLAQLLEAGQPGWQRGQPLYIGWGVFTGLIQQRLEALQLAGLDPGAGLPLALLEAPELSKDVLATEPRDRSIDDILEDELVDAHARLLWPKPAEQQTAGKLARLP
jgi:hypothetical protein